MRDFTLDDMKQLNEILKKAAYAYYNENREIMSNKEYDESYDRLEKMEKETGIIFTDSVTHNVGFEAVSQLMKEAHEERALSLSKTKDPNELNDWLGDNVGCMSWKLDGLTLVLTYDNGALTKAVTRGNGEIGEVVTHNAHHIIGIPHTIPYKGHLVLRGETMISYKDFERINKNLDISEQYKNPRNLASGTLRSLDSSIIFDRGLCFQAFELVTADKMPSQSFYGCLAWLHHQGFDVVENIVVQPNTVQDAIGYFDERLKHNKFPSDGLVLQIDDIIYARSLGETSKFPKGGKAFKWADETAETTIRSIIWKTGRTGIISPVAVFDPVELEGSTVSRATANNVSFIEDNHISVGSKILVYKANMIIPTIDKVIKPGQPVHIPDKCPACGIKTVINQQALSKILYCPNYDCPAKNIKRIAHFVGRDAINIVGLSENTISKLIDLGLLKNAADLYLLRDIPWTPDLEGIGPVLYEKLLGSIDKSRHVRLGNYIYALGIDMVGKTVADNIADYFGGIDEFTDALEGNFDFSMIDGVGKAANNMLHKWYSKIENNQLYYDLLNVLEFE